MSGPDEVALVLAQSRNFEATYLGRLDSAFEHAAWCAVIAFVPDDMEVRMMLTMGESIELTRKHRNFFHKPVWSGAFCMFVLLGIGLFSENLITR
jgi:hypothetical protein